MTFEQIYPFFGPIFILIACTLLLFLYRNYARDELFTRPASLGTGQLRNIVAFGRMVMKNSYPLSARYKEAVSRTQAAQAELDRRGEGASTRRQAGPRSR